MDTPRLPDFDGGALCSQIGDVEIFVPHKGGSHALPKRICRLCPCIVECLNYAILVDVYGVWGGTSREERMRIRQARNIVAIPVVTYVDHHDNDGTAA